MSRRSLILSILVVLLGGLAAFTAGQMLTAQTDVLAVARDVPVGTSITAADLTVASVTADPNLAPIPAAELAQIVGMVAQVPLTPGELLTRAQVGVDVGLPAGEVLVALPLQEGQFPASGLSRGQRVLVVPTPGTVVSVGEGASAVGAAVQATVADVGLINPSTQVTVVDVQLSEAEGPSMAALASTGHLALILLSVED